MTSILHYSDIEGLYDSPERLGRLVAKLRHLQDDQTFITGGGDILGPSTLSLVTEGRVALSLFEALSPLADTIGNHDFDYGTAALRGVIETSPQRWLCANVFDDDDLFGEEQGVTESFTSSLPESTVGLIGVTYPDTAVGNPKASDLSFTDPVEAVRTQADTLRATADPDYIVVISHLGTGNPSAKALASATTVDAILDGHHNAPLATEVDGTLVGRPGRNCRRLVELQLSPTPDITLRTYEDLPPARDVVDQLKEQRQANGLDRPVLAVDESVACNRRATREGESRIGNLVTDAYRWRSGADVAIQMPGALRDQPPLEGTVTAGELIAVVPFSDDLVTVELNGESLATVLANLSMDVASVDAPEWQFGHVSGAQIVYDGAANQLAQATVGGQPLRPEQTYTIATSEYYVRGSKLLNVLTGQQVTDRHGPQYQAVINFADRTDAIPRTEGRIQRLKDSG